MRAFKSLLLALLLAPMAQAGSNQIIGGGGSGTCPSRGSGTTPPATCSLCETFLDTDADTNGSQLICIGGNTWKDIDDDGGPGGTGDAFTNTASSVDNEIALFSGTAGKTLKRATSTGLLKATSGVIGTETTSGTGDVCRVDTPIFLTKIRLPSAAAPSTTVVGDAAFDTNSLAAARGSLQIFDGTEPVWVVATDANDPPGDLEVPTYVVATGRTEWRPGSGGTPGDSITVGGTALQDANFVPSVGDGAINVGVVLNTFPTPDDVSFTVADGAVSPAKLKSADFGDFTVAAGVATINNDAVALGTKTSGAYMQQVTCLSPLLCTGTTGETSAGLISLLDVDMVIASRWSFKSGRINVRTGSGNPPAGECDAVAEQGSVYVDVTSATGFWYCGATGWNTPPGGVGASGDVQDVGDCTGPACFQTAAQNSVLAGPTSGSGVASMRALVPADIPTNIVASGYQPLDSDLSTLSTMAAPPVAFGMSLLASAAAVNARQTIGAHDAGNLSQGIIPSGRLASTGTADSTTFLRGDRTWATISTTGASNIASGTMALTTLSVASGGCNTMTPVTATGALATDVVTWSFNTDVTGISGYGPSTSGGFSIYVWPTVNAVNAKLCNPTLAALAGGTTVTLNWKIVR